jgi:hypothetical protein
MDIDEKERLALTGDMGVKASAIRLLAARLVVGMKSQQEFAKACGVGKTAYNNMEKALQFPNREVMKYLYRGHRIDFNFMMNGAFSHLAADVQEKIFPALASANDAWDRTQD